MTAGSVYRITAQVRPEHRIEIVAPELAEGEQMEAILLSLEEKPDSGFSTVDLLLSSTDLLEMPLTGKSESFGRAGTLGTGEAAHNWVDLSRQRAGHLRHLESSRSMRRCSCPCGLQCGQETQGS